MNWSNATAKKLNFILNKAKLPTTAVKPNQFRFRWVEFATNKLILTDVVSQVANQKYINNNNNNWKCDVGSYESEN